MKIDTFDRKIMQMDCGISFDVLAVPVGLSRNVVWQSVKALEEHGFIKGRVAIADPEKLGPTLLVFIQIRTSHHDVEWWKKLSWTVETLPQIQSVYRMTGNLRKA